MGIRLQLQDIVQQWRQTAQKMLQLTDETPNLLARGHMQGLSDGLKIAAGDVDTVLENDPKLSASNQDSGAE